MTGPEGTRAVLLGSLIFIGAALLGVATLGMDWRFSPALIRQPMVEWVLGGAGVAVLLSAAVLLARERREPVPTSALPPASNESSPSTSLMTLPAIMGNEAPSATEPMPPVAPSEPEPPTSPTPVAARPSGLSAEGMSSSTLLIPFAEGTRPASSPAAAPGVGETVTRLVDRIDTMQRVTPASPSAAASPPAPASGTSELLLRLTRIPNPPVAASPFLVARRCSDCGESLGTPPHFEPCGDCGRALCQRCYWRTSSGPGAHRCTACVKERSVPQPPAPTLTFARPTPGASPSPSSGPALRPRQPAS